MTLRCGRQHPHIAAAMPYAMATCRQGASWPAPRWRVGRQNWRSFVTHLSDAQMVSVTRLITVRLGVGKTALVRIARQVRFHARR